MRSQDGRLVCNARFNLDVTSSSLERHFSSVDLDEILALLRMMAEQVSEPPTGSGTEDG
jgi:hypothetical protein